MKATLDACVLFPTVLRDILMGVAACGGFTPVWSARILAEWQHAAARLGPDGALIASGEIARLRSAWPDATIPADSHLEALLDLPDAADKHVLATAITSCSDVIVTLNMRDFPARALQGLRAQNPDDFLMALWLQDPTPVEQSVATAHRTTEHISGRPQPLRALLKRAKLPRLGKALDGPL